MSEKQNIKLYLKKSGDNYKVVNNNSSLLRKQANDNYLNKTTVYKKPINAQTDDKNQRSLNKGIDSCLQ